MTWTLVSLLDTPPQAWRNGGGQTRELLAWPSVAGWRVRMSVAEVASAGPFSRFDGIERWFAVLEGAGVELMVHGGKHRLTAASEPFRFDGAAAVECALVDGPTRDFNLMAPPGCARLHRVRGELAVAPSAGCLAAVYAHSRSAQVTLGTERLEVPAHHLAWRTVHGGGRGNVSGEDALWIEAVA